MADVLFQFCHDIICIDVSKTLIPSCFYFQVFEHKEAKSGKSCYVRVTSGLLADLVANHCNTRVDFLEEAGVPGENHRPWASNW
jgi:hypothetical protein